MHNNHLRFRQNIFHSAGWLFADLLLALTLIFIAASAKGKPLSQMPHLTPTATPTPPILSLDPHSLNFTVNVNPLQLSQSNTLSAVKKQVSMYLDQAIDGNRKVGFVLTFAGGIGGNKHAAQFNSILKTMPAFEGAVFKNYHDLDNPQDEFDLEIYFFV